MGSDSTASSDIIQGKPHSGGVTYECIWIIPENAEKPTKDSITRVRKKNDE